jgi:hypothetical protein
VQRVGVRDPQVRPATGSTVYDPQAERASPPAPAVEPAAASGSAAPPPTLETPQPVDLGSPAVEVQDLAPPTTAAPPAAGPAPGASVPPSGAGGYRVQVFAGTDAAAAESVRADVEARLGERAVVVYQAPYYKVRVGACATSDGCADLRARLAAAGFTTTWVVPDDAAR